MSPRSLGGWGNRTVRRKAQDTWQPTLLKENAEGWGVNGYKAYNPTEIKMTDNPNGKVTTGRL